MSKLQRVLKNFEKAKEDVFKELFKNLWLAGLHYQGKVIVNTPIQTWDLASSIQTEDVKITWNKIFVEVWTNLEYASRVEFWIGWNRYNYHKWLLIFKTWVWARMFRDTLEQEKNTIKSIISKWW